MHEAVKQPVALRLAKASANQVYGLAQYESRGPFPVEFKVSGDLSNQIQIVYDKPLKYAPGSENSGEIIVAS